jgi:hypothetical protein
MVKYLGASKQKPVVKILAVKWDLKKPEGGQNAWFSLGKWFLFFHLYSPYSFCLQSNGFYLLCNSNSSISLKIDQRAIFRSQYKKSPVPLEKILA